VVGLSVAALFFFVLWIILVTECVSQKLIKQRERTNKTTSLQKSSARQKNKNRGFFYK
jgi:hypothetical protein